MVDVNIEHLNAASQAIYRLDYPGGLRAATGLNLDPNGICRTLFGKELNACYAELLGSGLLGGQPGLLTGHALLLDGSADCHASTPDVAALDIIGDIDLRAECLFFNTGGIVQTLVGKWNATGNQRSYRLSTAFGTFAIHWSNDGIADLSDDSVLGPAGTRAWRGTLDVVNGANHVSEFFAGQTLGTGTLFDSNTVAGNTAIFSSSAALTVGSSSGTDCMTGRVTKIEVRNAIDGTVVANPDFSAQAPGTTSFVDGTGKTWTLAGTARIV